MSTPTRWIRVGAATFDTLTGAGSAEGMSLPTLSPPAVYTLRRLVEVGDAGITAVKLGREEDGEPIRTARQRTNAGQKRVQRLRESLGSSSHHLVTRADGRYQLHFSIDVQRDAASAARERLAAAVEARLSEAGWRAVGADIVNGSRSLPLRVLTAATDWLAEADDLRFLPPLLGADQPVPLATVYVTLRVSGALSTFDPSLLGERRSLADAVAERRRRREARSLTLEEAIGDPQSRLTVILGDPGAGKSSLLRRAARDVVTGRLPRWSIPVLVDLPSWWALRKQVGEACDIEAYGAATLLAHTCGAGALDPRMWAEHVATAHTLADVLRVLGGETNVVFLLDALDELSGDPEASGAAVGAIRRLNKSHTVVVTSRPAGFPSGLPEHLRLVLCELDDDGIQALIEGWFAQRGDAAETSLGRELAIQIRDNPRLMDMARNPFLLTLLCHLTWEGGAHRDGRPHSLPVLRAGVYEAILLLAREQARLRDPVCFDAPARGRLGALCTSLQVGPGGPRHFFADDEWAAMFPDAPPLERSILPARIVSRWSEVGRYHLVHLTIHEYLVARTLVDRGDVALVLRNVYRPAWQMIVRFTAGILAHRGLLPEVGELVRTLLDADEQLGRLVIDAAAILVEAGVRDSTPLLGYDLRERLWGVFGEGRPLIEEAAAEALAILDPDWTLARCRDVLAHRRALSDPDSSETALAVVRDHDSKVQRILYLLGAISKATAEDELLRRLLDTNGNEVEGTIAATVLAQRDRRHVRNRLASAAALGLPRVVIPRFAAYAARAPHPDLVPALIASLDRAGVGPASDNLVDALLGSGTATGWDAALAWVDADRANRAEVGAAHLAAAVRVWAVGPLRERATAWLRSAEADDALDGAVRHGLYLEIVRAGLAGAELPARLRRQGNAQDLLEAIAEAAEAGTVFEPELDAVLDALGPTARPAIHAVEVGRWLSDAPTFRRERITRDIAATSRTIRISAFTSTGMVEAIDHLPMLLDLADKQTKGEEAMALVGAIGLLAPSRLTRPASISPELHLRAVRRLEAWLDERARGDLRQQAADGLAFWDFAAAGRRRADRDVRTALARASAETGRLLLARGWVDPAGEFHDW